MHIEIIIFFNWAFILEQSWILGLIENVLVIISWVSFSFPQQNKEHRHRINIYEEGFLKTSGVSLVLRSRTHKFTVVSNAAALSLKLRYSFSPKIFFHCST
jgi:hypothetical protein